MTNQAKQQPGKGSEVWNRNEDGSITFKVMKNAATTLIHDDKVAVQVTFAHRPTSDPDFRPENVQFIMPIAAAKELAGYFQKLASMAEGADPASSTVH